MTSVEKSRPRLLIAIMFIAFVELISTAWISDDAAITLRTVLNFIHGYGPVFNIDERVQGYTHPLWFFLNSGLSWIIGNVFTSSFILTITTSMAVIWLVANNIAKNKWSMLLGMGILLMSRAFVDFSTSGLENPLSHLLIVLGFFAAEGISKGSSFRSLLVFFLVISAMYLNRPDLPLIMIPIAGYILFENRSRPVLLISSMTIGLLPVLLWTAFSLFYYGFPVGNPAYAKLGSGVSQTDLWLQGLKYTVDSIRRDPITVSSIAFAMLYGLKRGSSFKSLAAGIVLYVLFIISIGGDFMTGRFFSVPLVAAVIILSRVELPGDSLKRMALILAALGLTQVDRTLLSDMKYDNLVIDSNGIADERGFYFQRFGLLNAPSGTFAAPRWEPNDPGVFIICGFLGFSAIRAGAAAHYIDSCALTDPLLARLPIPDTKRWRIGHFERAIPENYKESIEAGANLLTDDSIRSLYDTIRHVTRGDLSDATRWDDILKLNFQQANRP